MRRYNLQMGATSLHLACWVYWKSNEKAEDEETDLKKEHLRQEQDLIKTAGKQELLVLLSQSKLTNSLILYSWYEIQLDTNYSSHDKVYFILLITSALLD